MTLNPSQIKVLKIFILILQLRFYRNQPYQINLFSALLISYRIILKLSIYSLWICFVLNAAFFKVNAQSKAVCISIDDLPVVSYGTKDLQYWQLVTDSILNSCQYFKAPCIGYVNESKLYQDDHLSKTRVELLNSWLDKSMELGNHTFSHMNYHRSDFGDYTQNIINGERETNKLLALRGHKLEFFRHPYLRMGRSQSAYDSLNDFLVNRGYQVAPVTVATTDYLFALAYHRAYKSGKQNLMDSIGGAYLNYMTDILHYYEDMAQELFEREVKHVLLVHANLINAYYLDDIMKIYSNEGYQFISQKEALEDSIYQFKIKSFGDWGLSWLDHCAITQDFDWQSFQKEPETPAFIKKLAQ